MSTDDVRSLPLERSLYIGNAIALILYGALIYMYLHSVYYLINGSSKRRRSTAVYIVYGGWMLLLMTFALVTNVLWGQMAWIEHRDYPGGPTAFIMEQNSYWTNTLGTAADVTSDIFGNGLLLYRCYIIWGTNIWTIAFPILLYLASTALAIVFVILSALPGADLFSGTPVDYGVSWLALSVGLNSIVTLMIVSRLVLVRYRVRGMVSSELINTYTNVVAILVESALPFSVFGVITAVVFGRELLIANGFVIVWGLFPVISPQLIILRVAMGRAWTGHTMTNIQGTTMEFASAPCPEVERSAFTGPEEEGILTSVVDSGRAFPLKHSRSTLDTVV